MASLKLLTCNVRGLRDKLKRSGVFSSLKQHADILVLVEMHIEGHFANGTKAPLDWLGIPLYLYHSFSGGTINPHSQICAF